MSSIKKIIVKSEGKIDRVKFAIKSKLNLVKPVIIYPYRGYGNHKRIILQGRILEREDIIHRPVESKESIWKNLKKVWKRYESDEIPGVEVTGKFFNSEAKAVSDDEDYFTLTFEEFNSDQLKNGWYPVALTISYMPYDIEFVEKTEGEVLFCDEENKIGVVSDIDDTIIQSDILNPVKMIANVLLKDVKKRIAFPCVTTLYKGLSNNFTNPIIFVSGSSYNLFDMLTDFCKHHDIPKSPFIMRDLGIGVSQWIKQDSHEYKSESIEKILSTFPKLKFVLIGDSGEKDPEIYLDIHKRFPERVLAIYIRHVHSDERGQEIEQKVESLKIPFLLLKDSQEAIENAKSNGWWAQP